MAIKQVITGDAAGGVKAVNDFNKAVDKMEKGLKLTAKEAKLVETAVSRIHKANETPLERMNRRQAEINALYKSGKLDVDQYNKANERLTHQYERAGKSGRFAFGPEMLANIKGMAAGVFSVTAAVGALKQAYAEANAIAEAAAKGDITARAGLGPLAQLAAVEKNPAQAMQRMLKEARAMQASGVTKDESEAGSMLFSMLSAGLSRPDRDFAKDLRRADVVTDVGGAASAFKALTVALGEGEVGDFQGTMSKGIAASRVAPAQINEIIQSASKGGASAKQLGISDEFLFAATAIAASPAGGASEGGTQIAAFLKAIESTGISAAPELKGLSGVGLVEAIKAKNLDRAGLENILGGRDEAIKGFRALADNLEGADGLRALFGEVQAAPGRGLARTAIGLGDVDPRMRAARGAAVDEASLEAARGDLFGRQRNLVDRVQSQRQRMMEERGSSTFGKWLQRQEFNYTSDAQILQDVMAGGGEAMHVGAQTAPVSDLSADLLKDIRDFMKEQNEMMKQDQSGGRLPVSSGRQE